MYLNHTQNIRSVQLVGSWLGGVGRALPLQPACAGIPLAKKEQPIFVIRRKLC